MENENKEMDSSSVSEVKPIEEKVEEKTSIVKSKQKKCCEMILRKGKLCKDTICKNTLAKILIVVFILVLLGGGYWYKVMRNQLKPEAAKIKVLDFIKNNLVQPGTDVVVKEISTENGLYKIVITVQKQDITTYLTKDGTKFFPQAMDTTVAKPDANKQASVPEKTEAETKTSVPTVDLFVMSYCPYGLQMERGVLPAIEALGNKIKFNLKFVDYTLHGPKELTENVNQYCIQKTQPTKLNAYLKCFWKNSTGTSADCLKTAGINAATVATCVTDTNKQFNPTEKAVGLNKDETVKFGVQGSPTLVVNGTTISSGRDGVSVLKAICSGFTTQPKECQTTLSAVSPGAGFDDQIAAAGTAGATGATADGGCSTPQQ